MNDDRMHPPPGPPGGYVEGTGLATFLVPSCGDPVLLDGDTYVVEHMSVETSSHKDHEGRRRHILKVHFMASFDDEGYADSIADLI